MTMAEWVDRQVDASGRPARPHGVDDQHVDPLPIVSSESPARSEPDSAIGYRDLAVRLAVATAIGILVGLVVLALEHAVDDVLHELFEAPVWVPAAVVAAGAVVTAVVTKYLSGGGTATTEVYVREFHRDEPELEPKRAPGRLLAAFTTLASGAPLGMEGPAVYGGSVAAAMVGRRLRGAAAVSYHAMLVAGAAAGIAGVFKAPAAGAIFALEVPFRGRLAGERVLPAIFGSGAGYLTTASVDGVEPRSRSR
jgi:CIC family chloride channel protein